MTLDPADWYAAAEKRWEHLPAGADRDRRVKYTFEKIREESELVALKLPELTEDEVQALDEEATLSVLQNRGCPVSEEELQRFYFHVDALRYVLEVQARFAKAPKRLQLKLEGRRFQRLTGVRRYLGLPVL